MSDDSHRLPIHQGLDDAGPKPGYRPSRRRVAFSVSMERNSQAPEDAVAPQPRKLRVYQPATLPEHGAAAPHRALEGREVSALGSRRPGSTGDVSGKLSWPQWGKSFRGSSELG